MMLNVIISLIFTVGGLKFLFGVRKRYNIYFAIGFVLYGLQYLLNEYVITDSIIEIVFNIPRVLGSLSLMMSAFYYLKEGKE